MLQKTFYETFVSFREFSSLADPVSGVFFMP
jgi:hypothetical protein